MKTLILLFSVLFTTMSFAQVTANGLVSRLPFNANDEKTTKISNFINFLLIFLFFNFFFFTSSYFKAQTITAIRMDMEWLSSTTNTADFQIRLTNTGTSSVKLNSLVIRGVHAPSLTTGQITWKALNDNTLPGWLNWPNTGTANLPYINSQRKLNYSSATSIFNASTAPLIPSGPGVVAGTFRMSTTTTWTPNSDFSYVWDAATGGLVCYINGSTQVSSIVHYTSTNANTVSQGLIVTASSAQPLNSQTISPPSSSVLSGDATICAGSATNLSVAVTGGTAPYTVTVTDGTNNYSATGASPVSISVSPSSTSTYSIVSVTGGGTGTGNTGSATVTVTPIPTQPILACYQTAAFNTTSCSWVVSGTQVTNTTTATASGSYTWSNNGQTYTVSGTYTGNEVNCEIQVLNLTITPVIAGILNLKVYLEGYYISGGQMRSALVNSGVSSNSSISDTIKIQLRSHSSPNTVVLSTDILLSTNGIATLTIPENLLGGNYYIAVYHRNSLETWSTNPILFAMNTSYDFTISNSQSFGNVSKQVEPGVWALYSGDQNQDGVINPLDLSAVASEALIFTFGYIKTDLTGDGAIDGFDLGLADNNSSSAIVSIHP